MTKQVQDCLNCGTQMSEPRKGFFRCLTCAAEFITDEYQDNRDNLFGVVLKSPTARTKKQYISYSFKWEVWKRDNFTCRHCGGRDKLTVDHIYPESKGGELKMENAQTLCNSCNSRKGAR